MSVRIANLIYPNISSNLNDLTALYPPRDPDLMVVRIAPSPTGMLHLGAIYTSMVDRFIYPSRERIFILRIEDTDQKRFVEWSYETIISWLKNFGIEFDEGPLKPVWGQYESVGDYGPYIQTQRIAIYHSVAKYLIEQGLAYPCFMTEEEISTIRADQELQNKLPGIYGAYSTYRHTSEDEIALLIKSGQSYVIRLKNPYGLGDKVSFTDLIKGATTMWAPHQDSVLMKSDWIPVYHLAAMVDDWLMGTTHIVRTDEWFANVPLHLYILWLLTTRTIEFAHPGPLLKLDGGNRRKLSKRKDPEADVHLLFKQWYEPQALVNYLANIMNSWYEERRLEDQSHNLYGYDFKIEKINSAGAIVDMVKIASVSQDTFARMSDQEIYDHTVAWIQHYHSDKYQFIISHPEEYLQAIGIERHSGNDPKRFVTYQDVIDHCQVFIDTEFALIEYPQDWTSLTSTDVIEFAQVYPTMLDLTMTKEAWFDHLKEVGASLWYASTNAEFKTWNYKGKVGDLAMILRVALYKSSKTPDLYETIQVMWKDRVWVRLAQLSQHISE